MTITAKFAYMLEESPPRDNVAMIKINVYLCGNDWYAARWIDGDYDGCDELDIPEGATAAEAVAEAERMPLTVDGARVINLVSEVAS